ARGRRIEYCLERCRVRAVRRRLLGTLAKGYRQRVGLADTLLADPPVLILDAPLSGLEPVQQEETLASIRELGGKHTVLFSSHHLPDVEKVCNRVIIINQGRIKFDGRLSDIRSNLPLAVVEARGPRDQVEHLIRQFDGVTDVRAIAAEPADDAVA